MNIRLLKFVVISIAYNVATILTPLSVGAQSTSQLGTPPNVGVVPFSREITVSALDKADGAWPEGGVTAGRDGALYGTAEGGGFGSGTVFQLDADTFETPTVLHVFGSNDGDGAGPEAAVSLGSHGELYGTTDGGGTHCAIFGFSCGTVYELVPERNQSWKEIVLANLPVEKGGGNSPHGPVLVGPDGALYGTTEAGGKYNYGTTFELKRDSHGVWNMAVLHDFTGGNDGCFPTGSLIMDRGGALYGTTLECGAGQGGVVYRLERRSGRTVWHLETLHAFTNYGRDGAIPWSGVVSDSGGTLFGTTSSGGNPTCPEGCGTVFSLTPTAREGSQWIERVLYSFLGGIDGETPYAGATVDAAGNVYGATFFGGGLGPCTPGGCGTVFVLRPTVAVPGGYAETILHRFSSGPDGSGPYPQTLLLDGRTIYGTTVGGGNGGCDIAGCGTVFALSRS